MTISTPSISLTFLGNDLPGGHNTSQTISDSYIVNNSITIKRQLLNGLKSSSNQVNLTLSKDCPSIGDIVATDGDIKAVLKDGDTVLFTGYLSTSYTWKVTQSGEQVLSVTLEDTATRLLSKPFIESGYHLFNCVAADAIEAVCDAAEITISSWATSITDFITKVVEGGTTCKDILQQMLYELGYVYYCDNLGELRFFKVDCSSVSGIPTLDKSQLYDKSGRAVELSKSIRQYRSVRMTYTTIDTTSNYLVYRNTTQADDSHPYCNLPLEPGEHFDGLEIYTDVEWAAETADTFREPALIEACNAASETEIVGSNKIIAISNLNPVVQKGSDITVSMTAAGGPYIEINAQNDGEETESITQMDLYATILYESSQNVVHTGISGGTTNSILTEDCEYIHTKALITRHANLVCQYNAYCNSKYTFYSKEDLEPGDLIHLSENLFSGLNVDVMIVSRTDGDDTDVIKYEAIGISVFTLTADVYRRATDEGKANTKGTASAWREGTVLTGTGYARGVAGNKGDFYLNTNTYDIFRCVLSGGTNTAMWQYAGNIKGQDADLEGVTYEVEYGLSTSPLTYNIPKKAFGYNNSGSIDSYGAVDTLTGQPFEIGFRDVSDWSSSYEDWYKGLYVWQRVKTTDSQGNITYSEPYYNEPLTRSLINGCTLTSLIVDTDGDGDTHTWQKNLAGSGSLTLTLKVFSRSYEDVTAFLSALSAGDGVDAAAYKANTKVSTLAVTRTATGFDPATKVASAVFTVSVNVNSDFDSIVFNVGILDSYLDVQGESWSMDTHVSETLNSVDVTMHDVYYGELNTLPSQRPNGEACYSGDYFIAKANFTGSDYLSYLIGVPYVYDGTSWHNTLNIASGANMVKAMTCLGGILSSDIAVPSTVAFWGWFANLVSQNAFIQNLFANNVTVGDGTGVSGSGFRFRAHAYAADGTKLATPIFDVMYGDVTVFKVEPATGVIYFGTQFWYDPSDGAIHSTDDNVVIDSEGKISVINADINIANIADANINSVVITNSLFDGQIDTPSFSALQSSATSYTSPTTGTGAQSQYTTLRDFLDNNSIEHYRMYVCSLPTDPNVAYLKRDSYFDDQKHIYDSYIYFYNSQRTLIATIYNHHKYGFQDFNTYSSTYAGTALTLTVFVGGDVFKFKNIPTSTTGLESGQVWCDTANGNVIKMKS